MKLLDVLYALNTHCPVDDSLWEKLQVKRMGRMLIKLSANILLPLAFKLTKQEGDKLDKQALPIVVSLTSFPARIGRVWMTIESMLRQKEKPQEIVLWLSRDQFPGGTNDLPIELVEQSNRGLTIRFVDGDIRSYKKFYYAFQEYKDCYIVTIDDDLLFPSSFLASLYACKQQHPNDVIASFGSRYNWDNSIDYFVLAVKPVNIGESSEHLFFGSGGGTLFEPNKLTRFMDSWEVIHKLCPTADDIYLNALIRLAGHNVTFHQNHPLLSIVNANDSKLVSQNGNIQDVNSVNARQLRTLSSYLTKKYGKNPFDFINNE